MKSSARIYISCGVPLLILVATVLASLRSPIVRASLFGESLASLEDARRAGDDKKTDSVEVTDYTTPVDNDTLLVDDKLADKKTTFDPKLIDRRPLDGWRINASEAVIRLDVPVIKPDVNPELLVLHPSYAAAVKQAKGQVLASVNLIDGKAKQFDDGLYAALDQAYYEGHGAAMKSHRKLVRTLYDKVAKGSPAADYLGAGLVLAEEPIEASAGSRSAAASFAGREIDSKPIGVYTWSPTLSTLFRVLRFYAQPIRDPAISREIARVLAEDKALRVDYERAIAFYGKLTNPLVGHSPASLVEKPDLPEDARFSLFPPSTSRDAELFDKLFPLGIPEDADLMRELITAIRSGKVDLKPRQDGGWYSYQVHALETLLLPEKGAEANKLLLTKLYKKRMLEAFKALMTKRRETHVRQLPTSEAPGPVVRDLQSLRPRLRVEPNPTYYLRTARSYAFLANFLESTLGESTLKSIHGLREEGPREMNLHSELRMMRDLFYGLHLLSAEDIGLLPALLDDEVTDRAACEKVATDWLAGRDRDRDLAADTRVSVPIYYDRGRNVTRLWMTVGVRLAKLDTRYVKAPRVRPEDDSKGWETVADYKLMSNEYVIAVDEFAEVEMRGGRVLNRRELRAICDAMKTKAKIVEAIKKR